MSTIAQRFAENTEALNTLTTAVQSAIDASASIGGRPVDLTGLSDGVLLRYQSAGNKWVILTPDSLKTALDLPPNLSFDLTGVEDGDTLAWNAALNRFEPLAPGQDGGGASGGSNKCTLFLPRSRTVSLGQVVTSTAPPVGSTGGEAIMPVFGDYTRIHPVTGELITVSASTEYDISLPAWKAFNGVASTNDGWVSRNGTNTGWIRATFATQKTIGSYSIQAFNQAYASPKGWQFQGSANGSTWVTLHTVANEPIATTGEVRTYTVPSPAAYLHYRLNFTDSWFAGHVAVGEIQFFNTISGGGALVTTFTPGEVRAIPTQKLYSVCPADSGGAFALVGTDSAGDAITRIDASTLATISQIPLASEVYKLTYGLLSSDKQFLYDNIDVDGAGILAYSASLNRIYTAIANQVLVSDMATNTTATITVGTLATELVQGLQLHAGKIYATQGNRVRVYNATSNAWIADVLVGTDARLMGLDPGRNLLFVSNFGSNTVSVIGTDTDSVITSINVGQGPTDVTASNALARAIVCNSGGGSVTVINTISNTAIGGVTIGVGSIPTEAAIAPSGKAYVACRGYNQLAVIDLGTASLIKRIPCDPGPQNVIYEPGSNRILVGCEVGTVQSFEAE
jgi:YVTN family beta-propeller protein